jgi:hypothetical protein
MLQIHASLATATARSVSALPITVVPALLDIIYHQPLHASIALSLGVPLATLPPMIVYPAKLASM